MRKSFVLFCLSLLSAPLAMNAQDVDDGYVHDVITAPEILDKNTELKSFQGNVASYDVYATWCTSNGSYYFTFPLGGTKSNNPYGIITKDASSKLKKITFNLKSNTSGSEVYLFPVSTAFSSTADLYEEAYKVSDSSNAYNRDKVILTTEKVNTPATVTIPSAFGDVCNFGIKSGTKVFGCSSIDFAWEQTGYSRTELSANDFGTICVPYDVDSFEGAAFYAVAGKTMNGESVSSIVLQPVTTLEAGMPYIFQANATTITLNYTTNTRVETPKSTNTNGLHGVFADQPFNNLPAGESAGDIYIVKKDGKFQKASTNSGVKVNRAYLHMNEVPAYQVQSERMMILDETGYHWSDEMATGIVDETLRPEKSSYELSGRKISGNSIEIVIENGKKILK